jgi:hypothetical protein
MDLRARRHYVAAAMNFLLILSAMLSAVTGAFGGARAPETRPHLAAVAQAETPCPDRMVRQAQAEIPATRDGPRIAAIFAAAAFDLRPSVPAYADRLIE